MAKTLALAPLAFGFLLSSPALAQQDFGATPLVLHAADQDGDNAVSADEWSTFLAALPMSPGGLTREGVLGVLLARALDRDPRGPWGAADALGELTEPGGAFWVEPASLAQAVLFVAADGNEDGVVDEDERASLLDESLLGRPQWQAFGAWALRAAAVPPPASDPNRMTGGVALVSVESVLDDDRDGRFETPDLQALYDRADRNGDGAIDTDEFVRKPRVRRVDRSWLDEGDATPNEDRPPAMPWQRNLDDALRLSRATGKPLLICVNIDGETASEAFAAGRYRDPAFVELVHGFVPLLVSPDRHGERDHADDGRRLVDTKFGRVTGAEHIDLEPVLFERYFGGRRVAPRHLAVSPDGTILFDLFLLNDLSRVDAALREHGVFGESVTPQSVGAGFEALDAGRRGRLEAGFLGGTLEGRMALAGGALDPDRASQHPELLRLALRDPAPEVWRAALHGVREHPGGVPPELWPEVFRVANRGLVLEGDVLRQLELHAQDVADPDLERVVRALTASRLHRVAGRGAELRTLIHAFPAGMPSGVTDADLARLYRALEALDQAAWDDSASQVVRGGLALRLADARLARGEDPSAFFEVVRRSGDSVVAVAAQAPVAPVHLHAAYGLLAVGAYQLGDPEVARGAARRLASGLGVDAGSAHTARVLRIGLTTTWQRIDALWLAGAPEVPEADLVRDLLLAGDLLLDHPHGTVADAQAFLAGLDRVGLPLDLGRCARRACERFPQDASLHQWLRFAVLRDEGGAALLDAYAALDAPADATFDWFHAYAYEEAARWAEAEQDPATAEPRHRQAARRFRTVAIQEPSFADLSLHHAARAKVAIGAIALERGDLTAAMDALVVAAALRPGSWAERDPHDRSGAQVAASLKEVLTSSSVDADAQRLESLRAHLAELGLDG